VVILSRKILFININQYTLPYPVFPLGVAFLSAACREAGYKTEIGDLLVDGVNIFSVIKNFSPDYIGLSIRNIDDICIENSTFFIPELYDIIFKIREISQAKIILGGSGYSLFPQQLLKLSGADFGVCGEGEQPLLQLLYCLEYEKSYRSIEGLVYSDNGSVKINPVNKINPAIIRGPFMPQRLTDYYTRQSTILNIQTQRGCPFKCCYCTYPLIEGCTIRYRDAEAVADDIESAIRSNARYLFFVDSVFNTSVQHITEVCEEIIRRKLLIKWGCYLRPYGITESMIRLMVRAGLTHIEFGSDSFCDSVLESYRKNITFSDILNAGMCAYNAGVYNAHFLILGGPGETENSIRESYSNSLHLRKTVFFPYIGMRIYPDTYLYKYALTEGYIAKDSDLLSPCFYISPAINQEKISELVNEFYKISRTWIKSEKTIKTGIALNKLRKPGMDGPLWENLIP